jgi:hypothetical protein
MYREFKLGDEMFKRGENGSYLRGKGWMWEGADGMIEKGKGWEGKGSKLN